ARARAARPRGLIVPGVEVMPHYFWTGSPFSLALTLHDTQKNLLVWGLDRRALEALPVIGNARAGVRGLQTALDVLPAVLVVAGVLLLAWPRTRRASVRACRGCWARRPSMSRAPASAWGSCRRCFSCASVARRACCRRCAQGGCTRCSSGGTPAWRSASSSSPAVARRRAPA